MLQQMKQITYLCVCAHCTEALYIFVCSGCLCFPTPYRTLCQNGITLGWASVLHYYTHFSHFLFLSFLTSQTFFLSFVQNLSPLLFNHSVNSSPSSLTVSSSSLRLSACQTKVHHYSLFPP